MNEIATLVRYKNDMINLNLNALSSTELKLFMAICAGLKNEGLNTVEFSFSELRVLTGITDAYKNEFVKLLNHIGDNLMTVFYNSYTPAQRGGSYNIEKKAFFTEYDVNSDFEILSVELNKDMEYLLNDWNCGHWSQFALDNFNSIKGFAAKQLFRILIQYCNYPKLFLPIEEAKMIMNSINQRNNDFVNRAIPNAMQQFEKLGIILPGWNIETKNASTGKVLIFHYTIPKKVRMLNHSTDKKKKMSTALTAQVNMLRQQGKSERFIDCFIETEDYLKAEVLFNFREKTKNKDVDFEDLEIKGKIPYVTNKETIIFDEKDYHDGNLPFY